MSGSDQFKADYDAKEKRLKEMTMQLLDLSSKQRVVGVPLPQQAFGSTPPPLSPLLTCDVKPDSERHRPHHGLCPLVSRANCWPCLWLLTW